jgi:hypothetical protein
LVQVLFRPCLSLSAPARLQTWLLLVPLERASPIETAAVEFNTDAWKLIAVRRFEIG